MINRPKYIKELNAYKDKHVIKSTYRTKKSWKVCFA